MIKAAIFDLGGVLASNEWSLVYQKLHQELNLTEKKAKAVIDPLFLHLCRSDFDQATFWSKFAKKAAVAIPSDYPLSFWKTTYVKWSEDVREVWQIAIKLKALGTRLAILSNIIKPHVEANYKMGRVSRLKEVGFEKLFWSCELGLIKPDKNLFQLVLDGLNLQAKECVFIDDREIHSRSATKLMGMSGIHFRTPRQLEKNLEKLGLGVS